MRLRGLAKQIAYGAWPRREHSFPYFGSRVFFPKNSLIFSLACKQGIYEPHVVRFVNHFLKPGTVYLDVGANIGLMSVAALASRPDCTVVSVEASPATLTYLYRTHAMSADRDRWTIIPKAIAAHPGEATFLEGATVGGAMDGLRDTGRGGGKNGVSVPVTTIDRLWDELGRPTISVIKMDIEGGEYDALAAAGVCLAAQRPALVTEWSRLNLPSYGVAEDAILDIARRYGYGVFSIPGYAEVHSSLELSLRMLVTETFVLVAYPDREPVKHKNTDVVA
jgi:FkbM family methyltransferase